MKSARAVMIAATLCLTTTACDFDSVIAPRVGLDILIDGSAIQRSVSDLDYEVELTRCRVAIDILEFTTDGEQHAFARPASLGEWLIPTAFAHPGHYGGGEIVGELTGRHVFDWRDERVLGEAELTEALYTGANFTFARARRADGLAADDPIVGHTFDIAGVAERDGVTIQFEVQVDQDEDRRVVGLPLELDVDSSTTRSLALALFTRDPLEEDTLFDGVDFGSLDPDADGVVRVDPGSDAYNRLRRNLQAHDHYAVQVR